MTSSDSVERACVAQTPNTSACTEMSVYISMTYSSSLSHLSRNSAGGAKCPLLIRLLSIPGVKQTLERDMVAYWHGVLLSHRILSRGTSMTVGKEQDGLGSCPGTLGSCSQARY